jgi:hypothetical protein
VGALLISCLLSVVRGDNAESLILCLQYGSNMENGLALSKVLPAISMLLFLAGNVDKMISHPLIRDGVLHI